MKNTLFKTLLITLLTGLLLSACGDSAPANDEPSAEQPADATEVPAVMETDASVASDTGKDRGEIRG